MARPLLTLIAVLFAWNSASAQILFPVPNIPGVCGVSGVIVNMRGGSGGASNSSGTGFPDGGIGGRGGSIVCTLDVANPVVVTSLSYYVGNAGAIGVPIYTGVIGAAGGTGYTNGGNAGGFAGPSGFVGTDVSGGGGGGSSAVLNTTSGSLILVAAGGGGGGALSPVVNGGNGGATGATGGSFSPNFGGSGGTPGVFGAAGGAGITYTGGAGGPTGNGGNGGLGPTGSQSAGGGGAGYGGGGGGGAGNTAAAGVNTITAGGGGGSNYVAPTAITTALANGTATLTGNGAVSLALYPDIASTTGVNFCTGNTSTFTQTTPGGFWSTSDASIATISAPTGMSIIVTGVSAGTANISYTASAGYWSFVTVNISAGAAAITGPNNVCVSQTIVLANATPGGTWSSGATSVATISSSGVVTGVSPGTATISYTLPSGCNATTTITVNPFPAPIGGTPSVCVGNVSTLTDAVPGGTWTSSTTSVATIDPVTGALHGVTSGVATISYGFTAACYLTTSITVNPLPIIANLAYTDPSTCNGLDGSITLDGSTPSTAYIVNYDFNGIPASPLTVTANSAGKLVLNSAAASFAAGTYANIYITNTATGCVSLPAGPITLSDPPIPPTPVITYLPICYHQTLFLEATDAAAGGTFSWTGPDGFTSSIYNPSIVGTTYANTGIYTVTYTLLNCVSLPATANVTIQAPPQLTNVTPNQTIAYGSTVQLNASNALYYVWTPDDGTLNNPNINYPKATPFVTTTYTVYGMNEYGCRDTAYVTIFVDSVIHGVIPTAFTPNGDGRNDIFHPIGFDFHRIVEFTVFNRWGQQIFYSNNISDGWDGTFNGVPQEMGTYYYNIIVAQPEGMMENKAYKGSVTLIR